jgi:putative tryptophan/tyrosine transport system substrate-binding protein
MKRRDFIALIGGAAVAWPFVARAQQRALPVIGFVFLGAPLPIAAKSFAAGLAEQDYVEGRDVLIEYRFAQNDFSRLPELVADLVRRQVAVIFARDYAAANAAKAATSSIPVVFWTGNDPVESGLVPRLNRPGGNLTGFTSLGIDLASKRLGLLRELLPQATRFAVLVNPKSRASEAIISDAQAAAASIGGQIEILNASTSREIDAAFADLSQKGADALLVSANIFLFSRRMQIVTLAALHRLPAMYPTRPIAVSGGLMSYGTDIADQHRQAGVYVGRILKGEKPADLPVQQATKFEFVINLKTAKALGLELPPLLLAIADEVIE